MRKLQDAAFAAGCFWGVEDAFMQMKGVKETEAGFMGGSTRNATYEQVSRGDTGHAETVHLRFNPEEVSYKELLEAFWKMHDPTTRNRQGPDLGSQYRSIIFYYTDEQKAEADKSREREQKKLGGREIVTEIVPAGEFWRADERHQKYHQKQGKVC